MKDRRLFFGCFVKSMGVFFLLWVVAMIAVIGLNSRWSQEEIAREKSKLPNAIAQGESRLSASSASGVVRFLPWEEDKFSAVLTMSGCNTLKDYGGQLFLRVYDERGNMLGQSQMLVGYGALASENDTGRIRYLLFDPALSREQQLKAAHTLNEISASGFRGYSTNAAAGVRVEKLELVGWEVGESIYVQKLTYGEEARPLVDSNADLFPGKVPQHFSLEWIEFYSALTGPDGPEKRMEQYQALQAKVNGLEENRPEWWTEGGVYLVKGAELNNTGTQPVAVACDLPEDYMLRGLLPTASFTLAAAVALALFTAWLETRAIRRERAFTRAAAHELKTPLAVLRTHAEALGEDIAPDRRQEYLGIVVEESDRMAALVSSLMDLSRLENGGPIQREPLDLTALVANCAARLTLPAERKGLRLVTELEGAAVLGEKLRLEEMVDNLLDNALRHCAPGGTVTVALTRKGRGIQLTVDNDGDPVPPEQLDRLFEPFYRGDQGRSREEGGTGLGLAVVRAVTEAHGGRCWAANRGGGVTFTIRLPGLQSAK